MIFGIRKKFLLSVLLVALFAGSVYKGVMYLESTPASIVIQEGTDAPYTTSQLEAMMHGSLSKTEMPLISHFR